VPSDNEFFITSKFPQKGVLYEKYPIALFVTVGLNAFMFIIILMIVNILIHLFIYLLPPQQHPDVHETSENHESAIHDVHGTLHPSLASSIQTSGQGRQANAASASNVHPGFVHRQSSNPRARAWPPPHNSRLAVHGATSAHEDLHVTHTKSGHLVYLDKSATSLNMSRGRHHGADVSGRGASSSRRAHMRELAATVGSRSSGARYGHDGRAPPPHQGLPYPCNRRRGPCVDDIVSGSRSVPGRVVDRQRCGGAPISVRPASHFS